MQYTSLKYAYSSTKLYERVWFYILVAIMWSTCLWQKNVYWHWRFGTRLLHLFKSQITNFRHQDLVINLFFKKKLQLKVILPTSLNKQVTGDSLLYPWTIYKNEYQGTHSIIQFNLTVSLSRASNNLSFAVSTTTSLASPNISQINSFYNIKW